MLSWNSRREIKRRHKNDVRDIGTVVPHPYEGHCYEFEHCNCLNRRSYVRNGLWILRQFLVDVWIDLYDAIESLGRFHYAGLEEYEIVEAFLSDLGLVLLSIQVDMDSLAKNRHFNEEVFPGSQEEAKRALTIEEFLGVIARRGVDLHRKKSARKLNSVGVFTFYDGLRTKALHMQEFWHTVLQNAYSQPGQEFAKGQFGRMQYGRMDVGSFHVCAVGSGYALLAHTEKELLASGWTVDIQPPEYTDVASPPPYSPS